MEGQIYQGEILYEETYIRRGIYMKKHIQKKYRWKRYIYRGEVHLMEGHTHR